ncbi:hypothetical protein QUT16_22490, partial [Xanthomonas citri pv. citri]
SGISDTLTAGGAAISLSQGASVAIDAAGLADQITLVGSNSLTLTNNATGTSITDSSINGSGDRITASNASVAFTGMGTLGIAATLTGSNDQVTVSGNGLALTVNGVPSGPVVVSGSNDSVTINAGGASGNVVVSGVNDTLNVINTAVTLTGTW